MTDPERAGGFFGDAHLVNEKENAFAKQHTNYHFI